MGTLWGENRAGNSFLFDSHPLIHSHQSCLSAPAWGMGVTWSLLPPAQPGNSVLHHAASKQVLQLPKREGKQHPRWLSASEKMVPKSVTYWSSKARVALKITTGRKNMCRDLGDATPVCSNFCVVYGKRQTGRSRISRGKCWLLATMISSIINPWSLSHFSIFDCCWFIQGRTW